MIRAGARRRLVHHTGIGGGCNGRRILPRHDPDAVLFVHVASARGVRPDLCDGVSCGAARHGSARALSGCAAVLAVGIASACEYGHSPRFGLDRVLALRGRLLFGNHPCGHQERSFRPGERGAGARHDERPEHAAGCFCRRRYGRRRHCC